MDWDHDEMMKQLREFMQAQGVDPENLDDETLNFISNLAAKTIKGKITMHEAFERIHAFEAHRMGFRDMPDQATFEAEVDYSGLINVTEAVHDYLNAVEQPGIADAIVQMWAHPCLIEDDAEPPEGGAMIAAQSKHWFNIVKLNLHELKDLQTAVERALRKHFSVN